MVNGARLIGPALAGIVIAAVGEGWCFAIDGISYAAVIASLVMMRVKPLQIQRAAVSMLEQLKEVGVCEYVPTNSHDSTVVCAAEFNGWPYAVLLPMFAAQVLHGGPHTLGFLTGASGVGALGSAVSLRFGKVCAA